MRTRSKIFILLLIVVFSCNSKPHDAEGLLQPLTLDEDTRITIENPIIYWDDHFGKVKEIEVEQGLCCS